MNPFGLDKFLIEVKKGMKVAYDGLIATDRDGCRIADVEGPPAGLLFRTNNPMVKIIISIRHRSLEDKIWDTCSQEVVELETSLEWSLLLLPGVSVNCGRHHNTDFLLAVKEGDLEHVKALWNGCVDLENLEYIDLGIKRDSSLAELSVEA
ncbi:hypothetical protein SUGI_1128290 [Cryptomeria japonica]|nr:hypothetical protein SUGI_1128290 [Cryptomeria japonica]